MEQDRWLSMNEIAAYLGVRRETVYKWITTRNMPAHQIGRNWKFKKDAVDAWVQSGQPSDKTSGDSYDNER